MVYKVGNNKPQPTYCAKYVRKSVFFSKKQKKNVFEKREFP